MLHAFHFVVVTNSYLISQSKRICVTNMSVLKERLQMYVSISALNLIELLTYFPNFN